jgi:hypothetical protein
MDLLIATYAVLAGLIAALLFQIIRRLASPAGRLPVTAEWIDELSIERYRPMMRLLEGADLEFLRTQPGFDPKMVTKLRAQRCQIFRGYLRCLNSDFGRVCAALRLVMLQSRGDRPDLAGALLRHRLQFAGGILGVQFRLYLYRWGFCGVDVTTLVRTFDLMRLELRTLVPAASGAAA